MAAKKRTTPAPKRPARKGPAAAPAPLLALGDEILAGLAPRLASRVRKLLDSVKRAATPAALADAVENLLSAYERQHAAGILPVTEALLATMRALPASHPLAPMPGRALLLQASTEWHAKHIEAARGLYAEAEASLEALPGERAFDLWSYAVQQRVRICLDDSPGDGDFKEAKAHLDRLLSATARRFTPYARNRALEAVEAWEYEFGDEKQVWPEVVETIDRALALPRDRPNLYTWCSLVHLLGRRALALRQQALHDEALEACRGVLALLPNATLERAREYAAWALAEGAFIAADLKAAPGEALPFLRELRAFFGKPRNAVEAPELAYGVAMEARCHLLLGHLDEASKALDELGALGKSWPRSDGVLTALVAGEVLRGDLLLAQGKLLEAHEVWRRVIERHADDPEEARRTEAIKARARMNS